MRLINDSENPLLEVVLPSAHRIIPVRTIMYIKADRKGSIITVNDENKTQFRTKNLLKAYDCLLSGHGFFRLHRAFIVNFSFIGSYCSKQVILIEGQSISLSCDKAKLFKERYIEFMKKKNR